MPNRLTIDVYVDLICPWCWIGKRHLDAAVRELSAMEPAVKVHVQWQSVQLLPDLPVQGLPFTDFYLKRLGSPQAVQMRQAQVQAAAHEAGLHFDFSNIPVMPNTAKAHRLLALAKEQCPVKQQTALLEELFRAHFVAGRDLGRSETLWDVAHSCGMDAQAALARMEGAAPPRRSNVPDGVPYFVFNGRASLSGAQPPQVLLNAMRQVVAQGSLVGGPA